MAGWNGTGTFVRAHDWAADKTAGIKVTASRMDAEFDNFKTGLENCLTLDGQNNPSADLPMNGQKHTGVGNATARTQYAAVAQLQDGGLIFGAAGGSSNAFTLTLSPAITAYSAGQVFYFTANHTITGSATVNVNTVGALTIKKQDGATNLASGDIQSGQFCVVGYDGTNAQLLSPVGQTSGLFNIVEDTSPQAGGIFDMNSQQMRWSKGSDVASANAMTLGTDGNSFDITGTTTIQSIGTLGAGTIVKLHFDGILSFEHDGDNIVLPGAANVTTAAGDVFVMSEYAAGKWECIAYTLASGKAIVETDQSITQAVQADIEAETNQDTYVPPDLLKFQPGICKVWGSVDRSAGTPSLNSPSYNVTSVADAAASTTTITIATDFSSAVYAALATTNSSTVGRISNVDITAAGTFDVLNETHAGAGADTDDFTFACFGDQ